MTPRLILLRFVWLLPAVVLAWLAWPRYQDGRALNAAVPVPRAMVERVDLPVKTYAAAADALALADPGNGAAAIIRAEALMHAGAPKSLTVPLLIKGLSLTPASARGWALLADIMRDSDPDEAARYLGQALLLAPYDYALAWPRVVNGALLWNHFTPDEQAMARRQVELLWEATELRGNLEAMLHVQGGPLLLARSFADNPSGFQALNTWLLKEREREARRQKWLQETPPWKR